MLARSIALIMPIALGLLCAPAAAQQDTGLSGLHDKVRVAGKLCMADHYHTGNSAGLASKKAAEVAAIKNWQDFTAWEYGSAWGSFRMAESKKVSCSGGGSWSCTVDARPCRRR